MSQGTDEEDKNLSSYDPVQHIGKRPGLDKIKWTMPVAAENMHARI